MIGAFCSAQTEDKGCIQHPIPGQPCWLSRRTERLQLAGSVLRGERASHPRGSHSYISILISRDNWLVLWNQVRLGIDISNIFNHRKLHQLPQAHYSYSNACYLPHWRVSFCPKDMNRELTRRNILEVHGFVIKLQVSPTVMPWELIKCTISIKQPC